MKPISLMIVLLLQPSALAQVSRPWTGARAPHVSSTPERRPPAPPPIFGLGSDYDLAGELIGDTEVGDFDADGWLDLAVSSRGGEITITYGDGTGSLADKEDFYAVEALYDPGPGGIGSADFDGNGFPDLVVTVAGSYDGLGNYVRKAHVYLTDDDRNWTYSTTVATHATFAADAAGGDFDEDGNEDLVVVASSGFDVFLGNGDGTFGPMIPLQGSNPPTGFFVEVADVDADGHLDVVAGFGSTFPGTRVFWGDGTGVFSSYAFTGPGFNFAVADVNRDGYLDTIAAVKDKFPNYTGGLWVTLGGPRQSMSYGGKYGASFTSPGRVAAADFNGDGYVDVVARDAGGQRLFLGRYDGTFVEEVTGNTIATAPGAPTVGDWNHDRRPDLSFPWEIVGQTPMVRVLLNETP